MFKKDNNRPKYNNNGKKFRPKRRNKNRKYPPNDKIETIEIYKKLILYTDGTYRFAGTTAKGEDIKIAVQTNAEYLSMQKLWYRYKPKSVEAVFRKQVNLTDVMLPELYIRFDLFNGEDSINMPINPRSCTHWSMLDNEVKTCYVPINPKTTERDNCDWQTPSVVFRCPIMCIISQPLPGDIPTQSISLGVIKFKVKLIVDKKDVADLVQNDKKMQEKLEEKDKEIQRLKKLTREMGTQTDDVEKKEMATQTEKNEEKKEEKKEMATQTEENEEKKKEIEGEEEEEEEGEIDDYEEYLDELRKLEYPEEMKEWKRVNGCKTDQEAWNKYDEYLKKRYHNPKPKKGKEYINPMPKEKKNKTFRQGMKKYEKKGLHFDPKLPKGKGCNGRLTGVENVGKHIEEKEDDGEENYYDPEYEPEYDYTNI